MSAAEVSRIARKNLRKDGDTWTSEGPARRLSRFSWESVMRDPVVPCSTFVARQDRLQGSWSAKLHSSANCDRGRRNGSKDASLEIRKGELHKTNADSRTSRPDRSEEGAGASRPNSPTKRRRSGLGGGNCADSERPARLGFRLFFWR